MCGTPSGFFITLTFGSSTFSRGDTNNSNLQNMEPMSEADQEQVPEDLGKLTVVDKARTGRVSLTKTFDFTFNCVNLGINATPHKAAVINIFE